MPGLAISLLRDKGQRGCTGWTCLGGKSVVSDGLVISSLWLGHHEATLSLILAPQPGIGRGPLMNPPAYLGASELSGPLAISIFKAMQQTQ